MKNTELNKEQVKAMKSCSGCLLIIAILFWAIVLSASKLDPIQKPPKLPKQQEEAMIKFKTIPFDESDLPYLENYVNQYFSNIELDEYNFRYFIDPLVWNSNPYSGKEAIMVRSAAYGIIKTKQNETSASAALTRVHIINMNNGEELGSYGFTGYKFK